MIASTLINVSFLLLQLYNIVIAMIFLSKIITLLMTITFCQALNYFSSPLRLYVADENATTVFRQVSERKEMIGILFTNIHCKECYYSEPEMTKIINQLWKQFKVKVYRAQLSSSTALQQQFNIKRFPMLHFVLPNGNTYVKYQNNNLVTLKTGLFIASKLRYYLNKYQLSQNQKKTAIWIDMGKNFFLQQEDLLQHYCFNPIYSNLHHLVFSEHKSLQNLLIKDQIDESQRANCHIYQKSQRKCFSSASVQEVAYLFSMFNADQVIQFTEQTYKAYQELNLNRYIFIAVLDSIFQRERSEIYIQMLNNILVKRQFQFKITIFWMEAQINKQKLTHLGFKQTHRPPLFSQFDLSGAPKKILTNKYNDPIFTEQSIIKFMKDIMKYDEKQQVIKANDQLLRESLQRLKISKDYKYISLKSFSFNVSSFFVLSFPYIQFQLLSDKQIFYKMILNYRYLIERVNRFAEDKIGQCYLTFDKYLCNKVEKHGLFFIHESKCYELSNSIIFEHEKPAKQLQEMLNLPDLYWINEDELEEYLSQHQQQIDLNQFEYVYIDV